MVEEVGVPCVVVDVFGDVDMFIRVAVEFCVDFFGCVSCPFRGKWYRWTCGWEWWLRRVLRNCGVFRGVDCGGVGVNLCVCEWVVLRVSVSGARVWVGGFVYPFVICLWLVVVAENHVNGCVVVFMVVETVGCLKVCNVRKVW